MATAPSLPSRLDFLKDYVLKTYSMKPNRIIIEVDSKYVHKVFELFRERLGFPNFYISTIAGTDFPKENTIRVDYYVVVLPEEQTIVIRTYLPRDEPKIASIIDIVPGALAGECETYDLLGVYFEGNRFLKRAFFVPTDVVEKGIFPLRKDSKV